MQAALLIGTLDCSAFPSVRLDVPAMTVISTDYFDELIARYGLSPGALGASTDDRIALAFQQADLPTELVGDLRAIAEEVCLPLAVRSSSLLEDALGEPFAGVYATKMIPNSAPDADTRFRQLVEAIKFVYASTWFSDARRYQSATGHPVEDEKMAVILQEVVGRRHGDRFYPDVSGVARSYAFYGVGDTDPADGLLALALGLGKTIVEGGVTWTVSPRRPQASPPFGSIRQLLDQTQTAFWAVRLGKPPARDPISELEYLVSLDLSAAEYDGTLALTGSTYDAPNDRLVPGVTRSGARALTFAPLLVQEIHPLPAVVRALLDGAARLAGRPVELEFAMTFDERSAPPTRLGFLQVRPMLVSRELVEVAESSFDAADVLCASTIVAGNGRNAGITDIVYVPPAAFDRGKSREIAREIGRVNDTLRRMARPYLLLGPGRWGTADPWLGIPVGWSEVAGARAIVEAGLEEFTPEPSQGSHFFHNLAAFGVLYFCVPPTAPRVVDWAWLDAQPAALSDGHVRHVRLDRPLTIEVDGRHGRGLIRKPTHDD